MDGLLCLLITLFLKLIMFFCFFVLVCREREIWPNVMREMKVTCEKKAGRLPRRGPPILILIHPITNPFLFFIHHLSLSLSLSLSLKLSTAHSIHRRGALNITNSNDTTYYILIASLFDSIGVYYPLNQF
jgi:hypothetical protein